MALIANCNRDPKRKSSPFAGDDFNPYAEPPPELTEEEKENRVKQMVAASNKPKPNGQPIEVKPKLIEVM